MMAMKRLRRMNIPNSNRMTKYLSLIQTGINTQIIIRISKKNAKNVRKNVVKVTLKERDFTHSDAHSVVVAMASYLVMVGGGVGMMMMMMMMMIIGGDW